jgi:hypothetical protein
MNEVSPGLRRRPLTLVEVPTLTGRVEEQARETSSEPV